VRREPANCGIRRYSRRHEKCSFESQQMPVYFSQKGLLALTGDASSRPLYG
jgi:hypothetical protein